MYFQPIIIVKNRNKVLNFSEIFESINLKSESLDSDLILEIVLESDKKSIGIREVQKIIEWNSHKSSKLKICIVYESELLTTEAQNSLLKVLEEPNTNNLIILITTNDRYLLNTVNSRCKKIILIDREEYSSENIRELINLNFIERKAVLDTLREKQDFKIEIKKLIENLMKYYTNQVSEKKMQPNSNMIELLKKTYLAVNRNVNAKLVLDNINFIIEEFR